MNQNAMEYNKKSNNLIHKVFFSALILESFILFVILASQPSATEERVIWIYSAPRFLELGIVTSILIFGALCLKNLAESDWKDKLQKLVFSSPWNVILIYGGILVITISRFVMIILRAFSESVDLHYLNGYATHLLPISVYFSILGFEIALWALFINRDNLSHILGIENRYINTVVTVWGLFSIISISSVFLENLTKITLQEMSVPYSPISEMIIFLGWVLATIILMAF